MVIFLNEMLYSNSDLIDKFRWCQIRSEVFGSVILAQHTNNSFVLVKFVTNGDGVDTYSLIQLIYQMDWKNTIWIIFGYINTWIQLILDFISALMMRKDHVMLSCRILVSIPKVGIVLFRFTTSLADSCLWNTNCYLRKMLESIWL